MELTMMELILTASAQKVISSRKVRDYKEAFVTFVMNKWNWPLLKVMEAKQNMKQDIKVNTISNGTGKLFKENGHQFSKNALKENATCQYVELVH